MTTEGKEAQEQRVSKSVPLFPEVVKPRISATTSSQRWPPVTTPQLASWSLQTDTSNRIGDYS